MICPKCNSIIDNNSTFCSNCGKRLNTTDLLKSFVGKNYLEILNSTFSVPAALFGSFYLLSRKMYFKGIIIIIGLILLIGYYNIELALLITIITHLSLGFIFKKLYLNFSQKKIDEIQLNNPNSTTTELLEICKKEGGFVHTFAAIPIGIILITSLFIENKFNNVENSIVKQLNKSSNDLTYNISSEFKKGKYNTSNYQHYLYYDNNNNNCTITIIINNTPLNKYIQNYITKKDIEKIETIHNQVWYKEITFNKEVQVDLITEYNNTLYHVKYQYEGEKCKGLTQKFYTSLSMNKNNN